MASEARQNSRRVSGVTVVCVVYPPSVCEQTTDSSVSSIRLNHVHLNKDPLSSDALLGSKAERKGNYIDEIRHKIDIRQ
ncbi:Hypothetical protein SMAX5B_019395 [Scophthalmus maximus]|uniref:Uncharacterized protein n=1 Tax=Scophthalmus maximus TaxID=52904 RepID=A0A2U9B7K7_SCOMX|nr:Hypothetical protein SMAX5B_019395 [Scophthalmus maximus]